MPSLLVRHRKLYSKHYKENFWDNISRKKMARKKGRFRNIFIIHNYPDIKKGSPHNGEILFLYLLPSNSLDHLDIGIVRRI
jgi:hypothetical protein